MLGSSDIASAAAALDERNIGFVLWGTQMLNCFGVPTFVDGYEFVVEDESLVEAFEALREAGFNTCTCPDTCLASEKHVYMPSRTMHLHISDKLYLGLYKKSEILWNMPSLTECDGENVILASDPVRLPGPDHCGHGGRFPEDLHPVRLPSIYRAFEALLLLTRKDIDTYGFFWSSWVCYILEYCTDRGVFDVERLTGHQKAIVDAFNAGDRNAEKRAYDALYLDLPCGMAVASQSCGAEEIIPIPASPCKDLAVAEICLGEERQTTGVNRECDGVDEHMPDSAVMGSKELTALGSCDAKPESTVNNTEAMAVESPTGANQKSNKHGNEQSDPVTPMSAHREADLEAEHKATGGKTSLEYRNLLPRSGTCREWARS